jgi:filamentous hemagglutinin family protein
MSGILKKSHGLILLLFARSLFALPEGNQVISGEASFHLTDKQNLTVKVADRTIINYDKFNISKNERVDFIQEGHKSTLLNRVVGKNPSKILGKLNANGRVFLVNPHGIFFGPQSSVNVASFLVSTLNIKNEDFLEEKYKFFQESNLEKSKIINEGSISANPEGFVCFFAPTIVNKGSILAHAGKIILASSECVTLDFSGDGLIQFRVEGDLKKALIENYGNIQAADGSVELSLGSAKDVIQRVVNTQGLQVANGIEEIEGEIHLVQRSHILAKEVNINGSANSQVKVEGKIDASCPKGKGGKIHIFAETISLTGANLFASGDLGGGEVFIGGDYRGLGPYFNATTVRMDPTSTIFCNAIAKGNGGKVILWADDTTFFDGKIYAQGGKELGDGGFVETSGKENLACRVGSVDSSALRGKTGDWVLDPASINIVAGGTATIAKCSSPNCADANVYTIDPGTIASSVSNIALCATNAANSSITLTDSLSMANAGITLTLTAGSGNQGPINLNNNISTKAGAITLTGAVTLGSNVTLDTTSLGTSPAGANITFSSTVNGAKNLTLNAGTGGNVIFSRSVGATNALTKLSFTGAAQIQIGGNISVAALANPLTFPSPVLLIGTSTITSNGANVSFSKTVDGGQAFTINSGAGFITFTGAIGATTPLTSMTANSAAMMNGISQNSTIQTTGAISYTGSNAINISNNMTTNGGAITFIGPIALSGTPSFDTTNSGGTLAGNTISFSSNITTLNGAVPLVLNAGTGGNIIFNGSVGGTTALTNLTFTKANLIQIAANIRTSGANPLNFPSPVNVTGTSTITSNNANITFGSTINGAQSLTLVGGAGTINFNGAVGGTTPLTKLSFTSAALINVGANIKVSGANPLSFPSAVVLTGSSTITSNNAALSFSSTINTQDATQSLNIVGGSGTTTFTGVVGGTTPLNVFSVSAATINQNATVNTMGSLSYTGTTAINLNANILTSGSTISMTGPVSLGALVSIDSTNSGGTPAGASISFSTTLNGAQSLSVNAGTSGTITFTGAVGGITALSSLNATGKIIAPVSSVKTTGSLNFSASTAITVSNNITTSGGGITLTGPITLLGAPTFDTTNAGGVAVGANINFSNSSTTIDGLVPLILKAGTSGAISIHGEVGGITPLPQLSFFSAALIEIGANITVSGANSLIFPFPVGLIGSCNITSNNADISFNNTLNGAQVLTLTAGSGTVNFNDIIGGTNPVNNIVFSSTNLIQIGNNITVSGTNPLIFSSAVTITGNSSINSNNADITFGTTLNGNQNLTLSAGSGQIILSGIVGGTEPLSSFSILSSSNIFFLANTYNANSQTYTTLANFNMNTGNVIYFTSFGGSINFNNGTILLGNGNDLAITTNGGDFSFSHILGTNDENVTINTGGGIASLAKIESLGEINVLDVFGGKITFSDTIEANSPNFSSLSSITNTSSPVLITSQQTTFFNGVGGNVGSLASPIFVQCAGQVFAGADGKAPSLAAFKGNTMDNTIHEIASNPPCIIVFNGAYIKNCTVPSILFPAPGFDSSFFNLASDYYFQSWFIDKRYLLKKNVIFFVLNKPAKVSL